MRLICGVVRLDGAPAEAGTLTAMIAALTSPGQNPRVAGLVEGPAALAVLDFSCTPISRNPENLPLGADGTWLAADLRLDLPAETGADTSALAALARWGEDLPDRLDGDFALAAWNPRLRRLLCARDIMGVRPLCYTHRPGRLFAFASLPRGLHASGVVARRLDQVALGRMLFEAYSRSNLTGFEEIAWLPAGHTAVVTPDGVRLHRAWKPDPAQVGSWRGSADESAAALRTLVEKAVACRLPAAGPVAAHLSGGLDSSAVAVIAARQLRAHGRPLHTYSQLARAYPGLVMRDEREYVDAVLAQEGDIKWSPIHLPALDGKGVLDPDLPLAGPLLEPEDSICAAAAAAGSRVLLSGAGGDESATYNGTGLLPAMLRQGQWRGVRAELRTRATRLGKPFVRVAAAQLLLPLLPDWFLAPRRRRRGQSQPSDRRLNSLSFLRSPLAEQVAAAFPTHPDWGSRPCDRVQMLTESYLVGRATRWSILGARHGVAFSFPLVDRRILDFVLSLPLERFLDGGFSRQPYRNAMAGILPESIRWRDSKFVPFPDVPANLAAAAPGLRTRVESVRHCAAAACMFDMDSIAAALSAASQYAADQRLAGMLNGQGHIPRPLKMALHAMQSLTMAEYVARST